MPHKPVLPPETESRWQGLLKDLASQDSLLVSFSGGVDSSVLLAAASRALGDRVKAVLCLGAFTPAWEEAAARRQADKLGVELLVLDAGEMHDPAIVANDQQRCYYCKRLRLERLKDLALHEGLAIVAEGSQADDSPEQRPGAWAVLEQGVLSPLRRAGLGKAEIRLLAGWLGLESADAPSGACLATRVPGGTPITLEALARVARVEAVLQPLFNGPVRVRDHWPLARLELEPDELPRALEGHTRRRIQEAARAAGYRWATLDLAGYGAGQEGSGK